MIPQAFCLFLAFLHQQTSASTKECDPSKQLVVAVLPDNEYYNNSFPDIEHFIQQMADATRGLDDFIVLYSEDWDGKFYKRGYDSVLHGKNDLGLPFGENTLRIVSKYSLDLWARDFGLVGPAEQVKFTYLPQYLDPDVAKLTDSDFNDFLSHYGIKVTHSNILLDGGNVVDNNWDKAIISERILKENKGRTKQELKNGLEIVLNMTVAFIPDPGDTSTTGHSDGIAAFIEEGTVLIADYNDTEYYNDVENAIKTAFPGVHTVKLECENATTSDTGNYWRGFSSAIGAYVNILVTKNAAYVPQFGKPKCDKKALDLVKANTNKTVVPIDTSKLSRMGGSVRCLTFQAESCNPVAKRLFEIARQKMNGGYLIASEHLNVFIITFTAFLLSTNYSIL